MIKKIFKFAFITFVIAICLVGGNVKAEVAYNSYVINSYNIDIVVNEDNTMNISEKIVAFFRTRKHGIYRTIPLRNKIERLDGSVSYNRAKISNIMVDKNFTKYNENGNKVIKIGDPEITLKGLNTYNISYLYNIGKDTFKKGDELYFNIIGTEWDAKINNVKFSIKMPKEFDTSKIGFSVGEKGSINNEGLEYTVVDNVIKGTYKGTLNEEEGITIRIELPEGYFVGASSNLDIIMLLGIIMPILFVIISAYLWSKYGKDDVVVETVEFYPPEGKNSAETAFLYTGKADTKDIVSLIVYLANKGYLRIEETKEHALFSKANKFKFIKLKEYDGNNNEEKTFLMGLFLLKDEVYPEDLENIFYSTLKAISKSLNSKANKQTIFEKKSLKNVTFVGLMIIATFILITCKPLLETLDISMSIMGLLFSSVGVTILFSGLFQKSSIAPKIFSTIFSLMFFLIPCALLLLPGLLTDPIYKYIYVYGIVCVAIMIKFAYIMPKRTIYGNEMLGKIKGFRNFLMVAQKDELESLVEKDPSYFYNILPYTYVLGVSDKWIKKFEQIAIDSPDWYSGQSSFSYATFSVFMNNTMASAASSMSSSPSSDGGGSGGGSSGGGSGGGRRRFVVA